MCDDGGMMDEDGTRDAGRGRDARASEGRTKARDEGLMNVMCDDGE